MNSFQSDFRACHQQYQNHMSVGEKKERWDFNIGVKQGVELAGDNLEIIQRVTDDAIRHLAGEKSRNVQIIITGIDEQEVFPGYEPRQVGIDSSGIDVGLWPEEYYKSEEYKTSVAKETDALHEKKVKVRVIHYKVFVDGKVEEHHTNEPRIRSSITSETNNHRALLERFSRYDKSEMGFFAKIKRALIEFFTKLFEPFESLSLLWEALTGRSEKEMNCDTFLLAEVTGHGINPEKSLTMSQSLKYMIKLLNREKEGTSDKKLQNRLQNALSVSKKAKRLRKNFNKSDFKALIKSVQLNIDKLPVDGKDKLLIPVAYQNEGKLIEMFLEVKKTDQNTCTVSLISRSKETLDLFDHKEGVNTITRSLRRDIEGVKIKDLQSKVPMLMELQTNPDLLKLEKHKSRDAFLKLLHFSGSNIAVGKVTESSLKESSLGHVSEIMSYVKSELLTTNEDSTDAERFEVAARLRFFLDFCNKDKKWLRNNETRNLVKTTAYQLINMIENNREQLIGDKQMEQGQEMTKIFHELQQVLVMLDKILPTTPDLSKKVLSNAELGKVLIEAQWKTPDLEDIPMIADPYIDVEPPFKRFESTKPVDSINNFALRCEKLMSIGETKRASYEAQIFIKTLPGPQDRAWDDISENAEGVFQSFQTMGAAITRQSLDKPHSTFNEALTIAMLNLHMYQIAFKKSPDSNKACFRALAYKARNNLTELLNSRISLQDKMRIRQFDTILTSDVYVDDNDFYLLRTSYNNLDQALLTPLLNMNEFSAIASGILTQAKKMWSNSQSGNNIDFKESQAMRKALRNADSLEFTLKPDDLSTVCKGVDIGQWKRDLKNCDSKISFNSPDYAKNVAEEIGNRYTTELCPYGCSADNCPNYGGLSGLGLPKEARKGHQYFPLYMLYHFSGEYCENLLAEGLLRPDQVRDLLLLQQTNENAATLYEMHLHKGDRKDNQFQFADKFSKEDRRIQAQNSLNIFLKHPNFFKIPSLRWLLETKLFNNNAFELMLSDYNYREHKPFLMSTLKLLNREASLAYANNDLETSAYLAYLLENLNEIIKQSALAEDEQKQLSGLITQNPETTIIQWLIDSAGQKTDREVKKQKTLLPYVLNYYLEKYNRKPDNQFLDKDLKLMAYAMGRYESLITSGDPVDPKLKESYELLKTIMLPKIRERAKKDEGDLFINDIINKFDPVIADLRLTWTEEEFPLYQATGQDERKFQFNLETGSIYSGGERVQLLPSFLKERTDVVELYGSKLKDVWQVKGSPDLEVRTNGDEREYFRVTVYSHSKFDGQRIVVRQKVKSDGKPLDEAPKIVIEREVEIKGGMTEWASYHRFEIQDKIARGESAEDSDLPLKVAAAIGGRSCWASGSLDRIYVFDQDDKKPYATMDIGKQEKPRVEEDLNESYLQALDEEEMEEKPTLLIKAFSFSGRDKLLSSSERDLTQYSSIEEGSYILPIGSKGVSRLEYPRLELASSGAKLSYRLTKNGAVSPSYPGWKLAPLGVRPGVRHPIDNVVPLPETFDFYQLLEKDGAQKVLIPAREYKQQYNHIGDEIPRCKAVSPEGFTASSVFEFSVNTETNRLQAKTADGYAYLAYVSLTHKDYEGAKYYLDRAESSSGYSDKYMDIFDWIEKWKDNTPNGKALKLHTAIYQDRIFDDHRINQIKKGGMKRELENPTERMKRLARLAELYHGYRESLNEREIGKKGSDPLLDLNPDSELRALKLTKEFVRENGDQTVRSNRVEKAKLKRAEKVSGIIEVNEPSKEKFASDDLDALYLWGYSGTITNIPEITFGHPEWILDNFGHVFNKLISLDPNSLEFMQLVQKIRFISDNPPPEEISEEALKAIQKAQGYLLRVSELVKKNNLIQLQEVMNNTGGKFPQIKGAFSSRSKRLENALNLPPELFGMQTVDEAKQKLEDKLKQMNIEMTDRLQKVESNEDYSFFQKIFEKNTIKKAFKTNIDITKKLIRFCEDYEKKENKITQLKKPLEPNKKIEMPSFKDEYNGALKEMMYGSGNHETISQIGNILDVLKDVSISNAVYEMEEVPEPEETDIVEKTVEEVYGILFNNPPKDIEPMVKAIIDGEADHQNRIDVQVAEIKKLEESIKAAPAQKETILFVTPESAKHAVLGEGNVRKCKQFYRESSSPAMEVSENVFDRLATSSEKAVKRLAEVHREDMKAYENHLRTVDITRGEAKKLRSHLISQKEELMKLKSDYKQLLLQSVERFDTPAGILVMRRLTGKAIKPNMDFLVNLWRKGEITKQPWDKNPLKDLGISKMTEKELAELELLITSYLDASTTVQHIDRAIHTTDTYIDSCGSWSSSKGDQLLAQAIVQSVEGNRNYTVFTSHSEVTITDLAMTLHVTEVRDYLYEKLNSIKSPLPNAIEDIKPYFESRETLIDLFKNPEHEAVLTKLLQEDKVLKNLIIAQGSDPDSRELLFMEHKEGIILRSAQVSTIRDMIDDPNAARQLIMGAGKSKVLSPLLALKKANGKNLVMLMLPEALYETNCRDLDATNRELFGQKIFRFEFNRHSDRSIEALQEIHIQLLETVRNKGFVPTTKSSMLSFRNAYFELLSTLSVIPLDQREIQKDKIEELSQKIKVMSKILVLFNTQTDVLADEIDACLDVRKEVNFALGDPQKINPIIHEVGSELMEIILSAESGTDLGSLKTALVNNTSATIPPDQLNHLMQELGKAFYNNYSSRLSGTDAQTFVDYIFDDDTLDGKVPQWMEQLNAQNPEIYKRVATAKAFLHRGYGNTLSRIANVNYGRDPDSKIWTIPYKASMEPSLGSEFDDTIERISFTLQDYVLNGVSYNQVFKVIADLHNTAIEELRSADDKEPIDINDTHAGKKFAELVLHLDPNKELGSNPSLAAFASEEKVTQLTNIVNKTSKGKLAFARRFVLPEITQAPNRVNSVSDDAPAMVRNFSGFTGTPWNLHTYNDKIKAKRSPGTDGRTWALLLQRNVKVKTFEYNPKKPVDSLIDGAGIVTGHFQATIDTGAYLRGQTNADYVTACLRKAEAAGLEGQSGVYFDESGKIVKKDGSLGKPLPIEVASQGDLMQCHTLYDQAHTVGADIKQGRKAKAVVTVGESTFIRDLFQAVWRLRQLHEEQDIEIVVSNDVKKMILGTNPDRDLNIEDILAFCLTNEARRESEDNYRAEKGKIQGKPSQEMLNGCADIFAKDTTKGNDIHEVALSVGTAFTKRRAQDEIFDEYAQVHSLEDPANILKATRERTAARARTMANALNATSTNPFHIAKELSDKLQKTADEVAGRNDPPSDWMPDKIDSSATEAGQQVEVEAVAQVEVAQMVKIDAEVDTEVQVQAERVVHAGRPLDAGSGGTVIPLKVSKMLELTSNNSLPETIIDSSWDIVSESLVHFQVLRQMSSTIAAFDPEIYVSGGVERQMVASEHATNWNKEGNLPFDAVANTVFYTYRKTVNDVVIVKGPHGFRMFIPTIHEAQAGCREFIKNANNLGYEAVQVNIGTPKPNIVFKTGKDRTDSLPFTKEDDKKEFYRLYVQAKFFNGEIHYGTADEKEALKDWITRKGPEDCKRLFESKILPTKPKKYEDDYPESPLFKIFEELIGQKV